MRTRLNKRERLFSKLTLFLLIAYQAGMFLTYSQSTRGDFAIYFRAGVRVQQGLGIYNFQENLFVYGPLLAHFLSFSAKASVLIASNVWLLFSLLFSWVNSILLLELVSKKVSLPNVIFTTAFMTFSFAFRNNAGNGSVMMIVLFSFLYVFNCVQQRSKKLLVIVLASLLLVFVIELKTYLAICLILYLLVVRRIEIIFGSLVIMSFTNLLYYLVGSETYLDWIKELVARSEDIETGSDQATILVFAKSIIPDFYFASWVIFLLFIFVLIKQSKENIKQNYMSEKFALLIMAIAPLGTIFAHGQDFVLSVSSLSGFLLAHEKFRLQRGLLVLSLSLLVNWTSSELLLGVATSLLFMLLLKTTRIFAFTELISMSIGLLASLFALNLLRSVEGDVQFRIYNLQALLFAGAVWLLITRSPEKYKRA